MTDVQLYLAIGVPVVMNLLGFTLVGLMLTTLNSRVQRLEDKIDILTGKVAELDTDLARVKEHLGMK